ncbi:MAG: NGG1p interacting factor NIF3 [Candidatus Aureabacteria bacterium]|nr:NGG1p interacting factor NIF3 [Candidatus Auribacterota bacterium]
MKLATFFNRALEIGRKNDPRGPARVSSEMKELRERYEEMPPRAKRAFDRERLENPYADTRILAGDPSAKLRGILAGIDIDVAEILLADRLMQQGKRVDLILSHHPAGKAYAAFYNVMHMQTDILSRFGVPINIAESLMEDRIREVEHRVMPVNHTRTVDAARLLGISLACVHTPADNCTVTFLQRLFDRKKPERLGEIIDLIEEIPEYQAAIANNAPPKIIAGNDRRRAGKIFVDMTGGTEGPAKILEKLATAGVGTLICMHLSEKHLKEAKKHCLNVVVAGHMASDALGLNILLDHACAGGRIEITTCSGFTRVKRGTHEGV